MAVWGNLWADRWDGRGPEPSRPRAVSEVNRNEGAFQPQRLGAGKDGLLTLVSITHSANTCKGSRVSGMAQGDTDELERREQQLERLSETEFLPPKY